MDAQNSEQSAERNEISHSNPVEYKIKSQNSRSFEQDKNQIEGESLNRTQKSAKAYGESDIENKSPLNLPKPRNSGISEASWIISNEVKGEANGNLPNKAMNGDESVTPRKITEMYPHHQNSDIELDLPLPKTDNKSKTTEIQYINDEPEDAHLGRQMGISTQSKHVEISNLIDRPLKVVDSEAPTRKASLTSVKLFTLRKAAGSSQQDTVRKAKSIGQSEQAKSEVGHKLPTEETKARVCFYRTLPFKAVIDSLFLIIIWLTLIALVYTSGAWWFPFSLFFAANGITIAGIYLSYGQIAKPLSRFIMVYYGKGRIAVMAAAAFIAVGVFVMAVTCLAKLGEHLVQEEAALWTSFALFYLLKSAVFVGIALWFLLTRKSFASQVAEKLKPNQNQISPKKPASA